MESILTRQDVITHSTNVSTLLTNVSNHRFPSFEQELCSNEFNSYICKAGKLYKQTLLADDCSERSDVDVMTPGHTLSNKKLLLVNALSFTNNLAMIGTKEEQSGLNSQNENVNSYQLLSDFLAPKEDFITEMQISNSITKFNDCNCVVF